MVEKVLMTGASGYIANQLLPTFKETYNMVLVDVKSDNPNGDKITDLNTVNLIDSYQSVFK